jgi:striatin 1/3/4
MVTSTSIQKKKLKQNSDDITKSEVIKRILKQKPNSYGGCPIKMLENKLLDNIIKEFKKDLLIKNNVIASFNPSKTLTRKTKKTNTNVYIKSKTGKLLTITNNNNYNTSNITKDKSDKEVLLTDFAVLEEHHHTILSNYTNAASNQRLSEKDSESSSLTQETILNKPSNFSISNSFSSKNNTNNNNTNSFLHNNTNNNNTDKSINFNNLSKDDSLSRSSIIFQPHNTSSSINKTSSGSNSSKYLYNPIALLKFHLDSVRDVYIESKSKILASIGEDTMLCFWDLDKAIKHYKDNPEPYLTFRIHTTPVFTLTGPKNQTQSSFSSIYTSGSDGVIRNTFIPEPKQPHTEETLNKCTGLPWRAHQDMIWQLNYHPKLTLLSSVSSDGTVKIFRANDGYNSQHISSNHETKTKHLLYSRDSTSSGKLVRSLMFRNHYYNFIEIPTSCTWDELNDNIIYVSHVASYIKVYDIETGQSKGDMVYYVEKNIPYESQQANKILYHKDNLIVTGHEDRQIRFFDIRTNSIVKNYVAHVDAISSLCNGIGEYELLTGSHDGTVRCWDLRGGNNKLIFDIPAHRKKYDEGCLSINVIKNESLMITSGADGIIKIFKI